MREIGRSTTPMMRRTSPLTPRHEPRVASRNRRLSVLLLGFAIALFVSMQPGSAAHAAAPAQDQPIYRRGGFSSMIAMGKTLFRALPPKLRDSVHFLPVNLETDVVPFIRPDEISYPDMPKPMRVVFISAGFVDLVNFVAHAKAIDRVSKGFFQNYVIALSRENGDRMIQEISNLNNPAFWTEDMMSEQESNFNQMVGILLAIELSHHYLGHYEKHAAKLKDAAGKPLPINRFLTQDEWETSVKAGTFNALDCGFGVDGVLALYEAIDKMPHKPAWTEYFAPAGFKFTKLRRDLKRYEDNFFIGKR